VSGLWRSEALVAAIRGRPIGQLPEYLTGISIDTRSITRGEVFFAIKGERFDGHDFATAAVKAGASALVVAEERLPAMGRVNVPLIVVQDVLTALELAGVAARARSKARIIAITGSVGKTTTKAALAKVLGAAGKVHAAERSFNNHWGVPLTLARMPEDCDYAVFEIGMNHANEIRPLVKMVRPHIAIVTGIAAAHLGHFNSLDEIAAAKAEIFEGIERGGHALVNRDDQRWKLLEKAARDAGVEHVWGFGAHNRSTFRLMACELGADRSEVTAKMAGQEISMTIGIPGRHIVQNALAVLGAAYLAGADMKKVAAAMATLKAEPGRGARETLRMREGSFTLIDESYNANPASMRAALELLAASEPGQGGRRIAVLGDMLELGIHSPKLHAGLADVIGKNRPDIVLMAGEEMKALAQAMPQGIEAHHHEDVAGLSKALVAALRPGDVVMIKSSNGIGFSKVVEALRVAYPSTSARDQKSAAQNTQAGE
jgi:UDP-N-acetylmuramoyl-tripeptide--D-alanyl-D-alanine ligase